MFYKLRWLIVIVCYGLVLAHAIYRDMRLEYEYCGDLRGRIVGARLIKDGKSPYFYKWRAGDGVRYYDPQNFTPTKVSSMTATPFFHHLLMPLAELPEREASKIWLVL